MLQFLLWSLVYPANLYVFSAFNKNNITLKALSTAVSCSLLCYVLQFHFTFELNGKLLFLMTAVAAPFLCSFDKQEVTEESWRDYFVAPAIEEFYYRCLLPQFGAGLWLNSLSFSLAHGHSLLFDWSLADEVAIRCLISFSFGLVLNLIGVRSGVDTRNFWFWLSATMVHGLANYVGVPLSNNLSISLTLLSILILFFI